MRIAYHLIINALKKKTKKLWLWLAADCLASKVIDVELGCRGIETLKKLWEKLSSQRNACICTDRYRVYAKVIPAKQHAATKVEIWSVEGKNAQIRHRLAHFHRKTFCYSKAKHRVQVSLKLLFKYTTI